MDQTIMLLEEKGYYINETSKCENIKEIINETLANSKKGIRLSRNNMITIRSNLDKCDHNDMVKIDQCLTREQNLTETEYQWGSLVMNAKWKII